MAFSANMSDTGAQRQACAVRNQIRADRMQQQFYCPICENPQPGFGPFNGREKARCIQCGSLERHRSIWIYFKEKTDLFTSPDRRFLHIAPEPCFAERFSSFFKTGYVTADLNMPGAMIKMDITNIPYPADSFEVIYSSHVLEHVADYLQAVREIYRVLAPSGWMTLLIPARTQGKTYRFPRQSPGGHIWKFGRDFVDNLAETGFKVRHRTVAELFTPSQITLMGLKRKQEIFQCLKRPRVKEETDRFRSSSL